MNCPTRSVTPDEAIEIWRKFATVVVNSVCSRSRGPRARKELDWAPKHTDMLGSAEAYLNRTIEEMAPAS